MHQQLRKPVRMESRRNSSRHLLATPSEISPTQPKPGHASVTSRQLANYADQPTSEATA
jgi:hypothetical protein